MSTEQPNLFGDAFEPEQVAVQPPREDKAYQVFLPGVKLEEAYTEINSYEEFWQTVRACEKCRLRSTCQQVVPGDGKKDADIMFVGEGPGADEDVQGIPFVGRAGQLLDKILQAAEFDRREIYIANVVKCRPPSNRLPNPDEVKECRKYLEAQIRIVQPKIIVCLGAMACQTVIDPKAKISQIRGKWFSRQGIKIIATYHPAALLRNPNYKRPTWEDFKLIRDEYKKI